MVSASVCRRSADAVFWPPAVPKAGNACLRDRIQARSRLPRLSVPQSKEFTGVLRLKRRRQFLRVAGSGRKWVAPGLILQARPHGTGDKTGTGFRIGYTVSRKVGNAVRRNRAKRRLRAVAGQVLPLHAKTGHDFVLIGRQATLKRGYRALAGDLETALKKLDAYHE